MAYAAVISLKQTIERLLNSSKIPLLPPSRESIELAYEKVKSLLIFFALGNSSSSKEVKSLELPEFFTSEESSEKVDALETEIREAACRLEDELESHFLSQTQILDGDGNSCLKDHVKKEVNDFTEIVRNVQEQLSSLSQPGKVDAAVSSRSHQFGGGQQSKLFGLDRDVIKLKKLLTGGRPCSLKVASVVGMAGIGKTSLAKKVYADPLMISHFNCSAFVSVGPKYLLREVLLDILAQINPGIDRTREKSIEKLCLCMYHGLKNRRYLIVLDDIWNTSLWNELENFFPEPGNKSRIMLTTRLHEVASHASSGRKYLHKMQFLNDEESWHLLREKVFAKEHSCPRQLEEPGREIAKKCEGLPLTIIAIAKHLSEAEKTPEYWKKVAEKEHSHIIGADEEVSKVLSPSYKYLSHHLKACFLYLGVYPPDYEIPASKLTNLWCAEGFLEPYLTRTLEDFSMECLEQLASRSIILVCDYSSRGGIKTCRVHSVFQYLCSTEIRKNMLFHVIKYSYANGVTEVMKSERQMCIHNNGLFGIKDVYDLMTSISNARSLLCTGPYHQYPVPMCLGFTLLRVFNALTVRFYCFPVEVVKLIQLRYLAFTYNGKLPASISKLWNLQYLIVHQSLSIMSSRGCPTYLPMEIWNMQELRHLQVMGNDLPHPNSEDALLPNLLTLLDVSAYSCTKDVLEKIPNLKKLGVKIKRALDVAEPLYYFDHLAHLHKLESLKCIIVNPHPRLQVVVPTPPVSIFPSGLKKLTLGGLGFPWEYMSSIAELPNLEVLKLRSYAFRGAEWKTYEEKFSKLKFLLLEDIDLKYWFANSDCFPSVQSLMFRHCYKLKEIPLGFGGISTLEMIELVDCDPSLVASANQILDEQLELGNEFLQIRIDSSENDKKLKSRPEP
ncbi:putative late blight resistance proteinR1A-10 [Sesamum alatum]|uniref:Late blight resistance proteinR1A-10 n=1 Tax=Sesamum alatum TaxID=300844 RepID=A0AAE1XYJ5_9LAMI|nr:putative late blight resistance proteinR1A-10 [Sesamum alatum]